MSDVTYPATPSRALNPSGPQSAVDLSSIWAARAAFFAPSHRVMDELVQTYYGVLPDIFSDYFHPEMHIHIPNMIRLAWDDLAALAGKEFPLWVPPDNDTTTAKDRAEKQEFIGYGYNKAGKIAGGISTKLLMKVLAWWLVGTGNAVMMTLPDYQNHNPFFTFRDPRTHYPPVGWSPFTQAAPEDALFAYQMSIGELSGRYPDKRDELRQSVQQFLGPGYQKQDVDSVTTWVGEYYSKPTWMVATLDRKVVTLARSDEGDPGHPGVMPVKSFSLFAPDGAKGRSIFADQISIQAAMARMFSQRLDFYDRTLYPLIFTTPLLGKSLKIGPMAVNEWDTSQSQTPPRIDTVAPAHTIDADSTMQFAVGLSRMLNRNPEQMQGAGQANSAKALDDLKGAVNDTVREGIWPSLLEGLPGAYTNGAQLDLNLWPNETKVAHGIRRNAAFRVNYTPERDLRGREFDWNVLPGIGLAGYQGTLELLQLFGAELISDDTALESGEWTTEPQREKRRIQVNRLEKLLWSDLATKAEQGILQPSALSEVRQLTEDGTDLFDAVAQLDQAGRLLTPPAPPGGAGGPGAPGPGGIPSELAAAMQGQPATGSPGANPSASFLPLPALTALRGGPARRAAPLQNQ